MMSRSPLPGQSEPSVSPPMNNTMNAVYSRVTMNLAVMILVREMPRVRKNGRCPHSPRPRSDPRHNELGRLERAPKGAHKEKPEKPPV